MTAEIIIQTIVSGLLMGFIYALIAAGLSLIFGLMEIVNFAHGEFMMVSMYSVFGLYLAFGLDPLVSAGWRAAVIVSVAVIVFTASLGYVTYLLAFAGRSRREMAALRSVGVSARQMLGLLALEHLLIVGIGLGLGTWAGFQMSRLMVSAVAVTEDGSPVLPPFVLVTDWAVLGPLYAALCCFFVAATLALHRSASRLDLHSVAREAGP